MKKEKYYYNPSTLRYEKIEANWSARLWRFFGFVSASLVFAAIMVIIFFRFVDSPKEAQLQQEIEVMSDKYKALDEDVNTMREMLLSLRDRDANIYRVIFEAEPIADEIWEAGMGGADRYAELQDYRNGRLMSDVSENLDKLKTQLVIQSKSYDEVIKLIQNKEDKLAALPAIQPVSNEDLTRIASGFGVRIDPVYGVPKMHAGLDFSAPTGTEIYATGKGVCQTVNYSNGGYGNQIIIDHGFGYKTLYAHLSKFNVREGQTVERGEVIGYVGNTGKSVGPHLHYEVIYNGEKVDPIHFFYKDLDEEQYEKVLEIAASAGRTLD